MSADADTLEVPFAVCVCVCVLMNDLVSDTLQTLKQLLKQKKYREDGIFGFHKENLFCFWGLILCCSVCIRAALEHGS
jgi:hypothetical protein